MKPLTRIVVALTAVFLTTMAACSAASGEMEISDVWGRSSPAAAQNSAFYMTITNNTGHDDRLLSVQTNACGMVELHEMYMQEDDVMGMRQVPGGYIDVPAGETVELRVGGLHIMCMNKQIAFDEGVEIPLTLTFETAGDIVVTAEIRESGS